MSKSIKSSRNSSVYKLKAKQSEVDETLFGNNKETNLKKDLSLREQKKEKMLHVTSKVTKKQVEIKEENITIPQSEILRMKNQAVIQTKEEMESQAKISQEQKVKQLAASKAKKEKMLILEEQKKKEKP